MSPNSNPLVVGNSFLSYKPKPQPYDKRTSYNIFYMLSFFCSIFLFLALSIFIIFKNQLSFSSIFNSTIFWFLIANSIIFIIAADHYGFFSLSQNKSFDLYEDDHHSPLNNPKLTPFQLHSPSFVVFDEGGENPDQKLQIVIQGSDFPPPLNPPPVRTCRRTKSEKQPKRTVPNTKASKKMAARRSESVKHEGKEVEETEFSKMTDEELNRRVEELEETEFSKMTDEELNRRVEELEENEFSRMTDEELNRRVEELEENEFSKMTDEELNRRVEEFIKKFNRQMRLQTRSTELN